MKGSDGSSPALGIKLFNLDKCFNRTSGDIRTFVDTSTDMGYHNGRAELGNRSRGDIVRINEGSCVSEPLPETPVGQVLIIEDDPAQRTFLRKLLEMTGYGCTCAGSCAEGREVFNPGQFAIALVDLGLPDGSGLTLLGELAERDDLLVPLVLTGDGSPETIIRTMRAGAFDYLTKPVDATTLAAAVARASSHYAVRRERSELLVLLMREKEQLEARVRAATADIRQYAEATEQVNARLRSLLTLTQLAQSRYSDDTLMRNTYRELARHMPLTCLALCDVSRQRLLAIYPQDGVLEFVEADVGGGASGYDALLVDAEPRLLVQQWVERNTGLDTTEYQDRVFPERLWNRAVCTVGFYLDPDYEVGPSEEEFLGMCAHFLAFEWEQANLLLHVAHHASLGSIGVELARSFVQPLTALRTATDFVAETPLTPEALEGMQVIQENVDRLRRQTQEFRKLSVLREDCVETVRLDEYIEQALDILTVAIQNRSVTILRRFDTDCECILLNGTALARTFLDLILGALRATELGGTIELSVVDAAAGYVAVEIGYPDGHLGPLAKPGAHVFDYEAHPGLQLAERTIHACGGTLSLTADRGNRRQVRVVLPRNATNPSKVKELTT